MSMKSVITIQPSYPLSSPSPPDFNLSQHQGLFQWVSSSHQVAKSIGASASASVLPVNIQGWFPLGLTGVISLQSKGVSRVFSSTTVQKHPQNTLLYRCPEKCSLQKVIYITSKNNRVGASLVVQCMSLPCNAGYIPCPGRSYMLQLLKLTRSRACAPQWKKPPQ